MEEKDKEIMAIEATKRLNEELIEMAQGIVKARRLDHFTVGLEEELYPRSDGHRLSLVMRDGHEREIIRRNVDGCLEVNKLWDLCQAVIEKNII